MATLTRRAGQRGPGWQDPVPRVPRAHPAPPKSLAKFTAASDLWVSSIQKPHSRLSSG